MKKYLLIATAFVALASCSDDTFVGESNSPNTNDNYGDAIVFRSSAKRATRTDHVGADAADMLGGKFYVGGFKNNGSAYSTVFDNYLVSWEANSAGKTTDNTSDWKYVGLSPLGFTGHVTGEQTIKYWDYSASYYDFVAYSPGKGNSIIIGDVDPSTNQIKATAIAPTTLISAAYTLEGSATDLAECYIADLITAKKSGATSPDVNYQSEVPFKFRRLGTKVRIALYETVPGYSVKDVKFYTDETTAISDGISETKATLFTSSDVFYPDGGKMTIYFPNIGTSPAVATDYNKAHVKFNGSGTPDAKIEFGTLNYETTKDKWEDTRLNYDGNTSTYLKRTAADPSFAGTSSPYYLDVLPDENGNVLELRVNYTLESIDGSKEAITVHGAKAFVPQVYAEWKPNYAYTYLFKISDNSNGWTSTTDTDPAGLYPITFDAVVADSEDGTQSTITTVATPAITTYQKGHVYNDGTPNDDYDKDKGAIYIMVQDADLKGNLDSKGKLYTVTTTGAAISEATVMDALNIQITGSATVNGRNGIALTAATTTSVSEIAATDSPDGNAIPVTTKVTLSTKPSDWPTDYYTDEACENAATGDFPTGGGTHTYYRKNTAVKFTPAAGTYAYAYEVSDGDDTEIHTAVVLDAAPSDWSTSYTTYFTDEACTTTAPSTFPTLGTGKKVTYYQKYTNLNKVYAVKVIKVVN